jgi:hypothetical protein
VIAPWIIEDIRRREREHEEERQIPLELPLPLPYWREPDEASPPPDDRGVVIIQF